MKKLIILFLIIPLLATAQTFTGHAKVSVAKGISVLEKAYLDFGELIVNGEGTITIAPNGTPTITGSLTQKNVTSVGVLQVNGMPNSSIVLTLPTTATMTYNSFSLYVTEFKSDFVPTTKLDANGILNLSIGAKLSIPANFNYGGYIGTYSVTISYQ